MSLDISTLYLVASLVGAMLGAMLLYFGRQERIGALTWWGCAYILGASSVALWSAAGPMLGEAGTLAAKLAGFIACGMVWIAARVFHGRRVNWPGLFAGSVIWAALVYLLPELSPWTMTTAGAAIVAAYAMLTARELALERRKAMQRRWPSAIVPLLHGFVLMLPILIGDLTRSADGAVLEQFWITAFTVELVLYAVGTVFVIFMLVSERTVHAHKTAASIDPLTGLFNRRGFGEATSRMIEREAKAGRPVTVMIFDIDHFKSINDRFGHAAGDEMLKLFASVVTNTLRITDLSGRVGGEEFAAMLPCSLSEALTAAERVREAFAQSGIAIDNAPIEATVSIGVAGGPAETELEILLAAADTALYQAKRGGRNRVEAAAELPISLEDGRRRSAGQPARAVVVRHGHA